MANYGTELFKGRLWTSNIKVSDINAPAEEFIIDPNLPVLGMDPRYPTTDMVVIPRGRLISVKPGVFDGSGAGSSYGKAVLTIANGKDIRPMGYTDTNLFKENPMREQKKPKIVKQEFIELPYIHAVNNAYGQLNHGDRITAFYGTTEKDNPNPEQVGRVVKFVPKTTYCQTNATAATGFLLTEAKFGAFTPTIVSAVTSASLIIDPTSGSLTWDTVNHAWYASFATPVKQVLYTYGQDFDQIAGEVLHIEPIDATHEFHGWLKWVTDNFNAMDYAPVAIRVPTTAADTTSGYAAINSLGYMQLSRPVAFQKRISVYADATVIDQNGDTVTYTSGGDAMPLADVPYANWTYGKWFTIDPYTGVLSFSSNVTLTGNVRVVYEYETSYRDGRLWGAGIQGLTDGNLSGLPGVPAHLDAPNLLGALRVIVN